MWERCATLKKKRTEGREFQAEFLDILRGRCWCRTAHTMEDALWSQLVSPWLKSQPLVKAAGPPVWVFLFIYKMETLILTCRVVVRQKRTVLLKPPWSQLALFPQSLR